MGSFQQCVAVLLTLTGIVSAYRYDPAYTEYNLNQNQYAIDPIDYWGQWHEDVADYTPSPENWRIPFYTLFLDRYVNGDPYNDDINGTAFERDPNSNQMRHGGDLEGLISSLDYIQGMGIKALYIAGSPFMNQPWGYDQYSPIDLSLLEPHFGTLETWRRAVKEIHARGMRVVLDNTIATLGDLIGFEGYLNTSTPFTVKEHRAQWKTDRRYLDFDFGNTYNETCVYPRFWNETGFPIDQSARDQLVGCYDSDFDQYGDTEAFGVYPDWRRQLTKFASVQDRLREWHPPVRAKLENFYCMLIAQLDIDGFRYDKATQGTPDAIAAMSASFRECARMHGKENFYITGEITGGNTFASIYVGRGRQPDQLPDNLTQAITMKHNSSDEFFIREQQQSAMDSGAFHYTVYRTLTRFLGMDGNLEAGYDAPRDFVDMWNTLLLTNDMTNANTGEFDPRHMYGVTNQDVFRWPAIRQGLHRQIIGHFITTLLMPGIPKLLWGEEQAYYVLDSTNSNYMFGRQPMSAATAWQTHGCYGLDSTQYYKMPFEAARHGCNDDTVSYDHRDPSAETRNILRRMYHLRELYPVLNDGFFLQQLSNQTRGVVYEGSSGVVTETGLWSVMRSTFPGVQDLSEQWTGRDDTTNSTPPRTNRDNLPVWLVYTNVNETETYEFDCSDNSTDMNSTAMISPYSAGTKVKNLFHPYDEHTLINSTQYLGIGNSSKPNGCLARLELQAFGFGAYVPIKYWRGPEPVITKFSPGHDAILLSTAAKQVKVELEFSEEMNCNNVTRTIVFESRTEGGDIRPVIDQDSVSCGMMENATNSTLVAGLSSAWRWSATLTNVEDGVHRLTVPPVKTPRGKWTKSKDHFLIRVGQPNNPVVFTRTANYSSTLLVQAANDKLMLNHSAAGADLFRYSTNFGTSFSEWTPYNGGMTEIEKQAWTGTNSQAWTGEHVRVEYFSRFRGSADHVQQGDLGTKQRRLPHLFLNGPYNSYGYDGGLDNSLKLHNDNEWSLDWMTEWSTSGAVAQLNVWGINPDGQPDQTQVFGDIDGDSVLDRLPPSSLAKLVLNITDAPPKPHLAWKILVNDGNMRFQLIPVGNMNYQLALYVILWILPLITAAASAWIFVLGFYKIKLNSLGATKKVVSILPVAVRRPLSKLFHARHRLYETKFDSNGASEKVPSILPVAIRRPLSKLFLSRPTSEQFLQVHPKPATEPAITSQRTVLIATMEYNIDDWNIKIKIGGLGVMSQLMGTNIPNLIWVVPCVGGIDYPIDEPAAPMNVTILGTTYTVNVQYHTVKNITYVLLDAPVFRKQTKAEPYPARMDDMESAIYYSAWNQCIAQSIQRFPEVDIYHINDYHGTIAPLYLLPRTIPVCLSLHNAEFQGLWPMRRVAEKEEICMVFNLPVATVTRYVQFGQVFNLLHAGASLLRLHQEGFGAVGVSKKYGKRSHARYSIFWGLGEVKALQNPDPSDLGAIEPASNGLPAAIAIDTDWEENRIKLRTEAQEWAGLEVNPKAELFVFVGRWSMQKGVDLIADAFPSILESNPNVQLITIGPVIDLYGKFAALKLQKLMEKYPKRVFSKPEFTALPPCIFTGAEFALIPSRDEPFGLVAVEFGRKGALGVGAKVGGLGQMPGWWFTIESTSTIHILNQFKGAIREALASPTETRARMRAISAKQRFPVAEWSKELEKLQSKAIAMHDKVRSKKMMASTTTLVNTEGNFSALSSAAPSRRNSMVSDDGLTMATQSKRSSVNNRLSVQSNSAHSTDEDDAIRVIPDEGDVPQLPPISNIARFSTPDLDCLSALPRIGNPRRTSRQPSELSLDTVIGQKTGYSLQDVDPFFTDSNGTFYKNFEKKLRNLNGRNSETSNCIEEYLLKSEKEWATNIRNAKLGRNKSDTNLSELKKRPFSWVTAVGSESHDSDSDLEKHASSGSSDQNDEYQLGDDYKPPRYLRNWMQIRLGSWPLYSFILAVGQIISANSYQITLLTGEVGQPAAKLYAIASVYLAASIGWWMMYRRFASLYALSLPFLFYGLAFVFIGVAHLANPVGTNWIQNIGTGLYAVASASGSLYFALNFGDDAGGRVHHWVFRACMIQGTQQIYVVALWFWGRIVTRQSSLGITTEVGAGFAGTWKITAVALPIAGLLWAMGLVLFFGLPTYYRQSPGETPAFYAAVLRRKVVIMFGIMVVVQNFFMSAPYGRNWSFLFSSSHVPTWQILCLAAGFFVGVWAICLWILGHFSRSHTWLVPVFAIGLGAPRFAQIWWGTSNIGLWLPWTGGFVQSAFLSRAVWCWLGVLDVVQGVGLGMILLGTLTRSHVAFTVTGCQVIGSAVTILARGVAPNKIGPGLVSPDISGGIDALWEPWFWCGLAAQLLLCVGFFKVYRKEQLQKP